MKKRNLLTGSLLVLTMWCNCLLASSHFPENPYAPQFVQTSFESSNNNPAAFFDEPPVSPQDTIPLEDRYGDFLNDQGRNPFDLADPQAIEQNVEYDPETGQYIITETIGGDFYRPPTYMTFQEYLDYQSEQQERDYFNQLSGVGTGASASGRLDPLGKVDVDNQLLDRLFGGTEVDIRPSGNIDLTFGFETSRTQNPTLTERQQNRGGFLFDMAIQMNVEGSIGEKLRLATNYNTQATFDFDNTMKLEYGTDAFGEDDILKKIEAGNVSLPLQGQLIEGSQSLFGIRTDLQFGKLRLSLVASQQNSERENITLENGSQIQEFSVFADEYDENRNFFLSHYNREHFEDALKNLPQIRTLFRITKLQVWITDTRNSTDNIRDIVAIADLGETERFTNPDFITPGTPTIFDREGDALPANENNSIWEDLRDNPQAKRVDRAVNTLRAAPFNMQQGRDFEKVTARLLSPTEYTFHPQLGFISLKTNIQADQVVAVSYEYTYQGEFYQVGQMAEDVLQNEDATTQNVLFTKMLKGTIQPVELPTWDLMMKNIYNIGAYGVTRDDFRLGIFYEDPGEGIKQFMPAEEISEVPLLRVFNLDQLNVQNDPQPDGVFDFVDSLTINTKTGRIMFPVLEPFGSALEKELKDNPLDVAKFVYQELYDETLFNAREFPEKNRFIIKGSYKSSVSSEISLGAFNIPQGSVRVTAGGQQLREGTDYEVDYNIGRVRILNDAILNAGVPINVSFEDNTLFGFQRKTMLGMRADYDVNKNLVIGGTYLHLFERPFTQKVNIGDDPINNRIFGLDMTYNKEAPWLTRIVDAIPGISTSEMSNISFTAETAALKPGHARAITEDSTDDGDTGGVVYLDDFEGSVASIDVRTPFNGSNGWSLASIPQDFDAIRPCFPEAEFKDTVLSGVNRAHLSWYRIDPSLPDEPNPYTIRIDQQEIFPNFTPQQNFGNTFTQILDVEYDPTCRGPYNFDLPDNGTGVSSGITQDGKLKDPETRWAGMMRQMTTNDFQSANIEFIEFWMLSPFLDTTGAVGPNMDANDGGMNGNLYINLGNISEDILPDSRRFFENGLPIVPQAGEPEFPTVTTAWGRVPLIQEVVRAFDANPENRELQDVGLDGYDDMSELTHFSDYIDATAGLNSEARQKILDDPSNDNFIHYRDERFTQDAPIKTRYRNFYGTEGNTPASAGSNFTISSTQQPDSEDLDGDRTMNETESFFQYRVPIEYDPTGATPGFVRMDNNPFITEFITSNDGRRTWYRYRVPLNLPENHPNFETIGGIRDFRSIRFMRMYFKDFAKPINFRFATLELVRNQWRRYTQQIPLEETGCFLDPENINSTTLEVDAVNIEENSNRQPFNYVLPPGISREQALGVNLNALQNEQSLSLTVCDLNGGDSRGIFKNLNLDMRYFTKLKMFVHAEDTDCNPNAAPLETGDLRLFVRLGSDLKNNFYEYDIPLQVSELTDLTPSDPEYLRIVWPSENDININFEALRRMKRERNSSSVPLNELYTWNPDVNDISSLDLKDNETYRVVGAPNLGLIKSVMVGIHNPSEECEQQYSAEVWINEMRVFGLDERGGVAGVARLDMQLADLGSLTLSGKASSIGFGALDQQLADRSREAIYQYDIATQLQLDKFLPEKTGLNIPFYFQVSNETRTPQFDPYDLDIELDDKVSDARNDGNPDTDPTQIRQDAQTVTKIKSYNFTNVRKERTKPDKKPMPWDVANFSLTYAFDETESRDPIVEKDVLTRRRGALDYTFSRKVKYIEPLKKAIKSKNLQFLSKINFNPLPNSFSFSTDLDRRFNTTKYRFAGENPLFNTYYNKQFIWTRNYDLQWDFTRSLKFKFFADNIGTIDEPDETLMLARSMRSPGDEGYIANIGQHRRDSIWSNIQNFGRNKSYNHSLQLNYKVPLKLFPYLDWVSLDANYRADFGWSAASLAALSLGNVINNGQTRSLNAKLDFKKLYNYSGYLKQINSKRRGRGGSRGGGRGGDTRGRGTDNGRGGPGGGISGGGDRGGKGGRSDASSDKKDNKRDKRNKKGKGADKSGGGGDPGGGLAGSAGGRDRGNKDKKKDKKDKKGKSGPGELERALIRPLMALRSIDARFEQRFSTTIPGYMPNTDYFGMNDFGSPGWEFVAGLQPNLNIEDYYTDRDFLYSNREWFSNDPLLNQQVKQTYTETFRLQKIEIEPFQDFRIDFSAERVKNRSHAEIFSSVTDITEDPDFQHQGRIDYRDIRVSYLAINTLFDNDLDALFDKFIENRVVISRRLGSGQHAEEVWAGQGYAEGYSGLHPSVLYPAFFAAYTGEDAATVELDAEDYQGNVLMKTLPRPNWNLTYNGLSKLGFFEDIFQSFSLKHGYKGNLRVSQFQSETLYEFDQPVIKEETLDFFTRFEAPDIRIEEQFNPLVGLDMRFKNDLSLRAEYKTSRSMQLRIQGKNVEVSKGTEFVIGAGYKLKEVQLGFLPKQKKRGGRADKDKPGGSGRSGGRRGASNEGDLDITFDFSIRDDVSNVNTYGTGDGTEYEFPVRGNRLVSILPQVTYQLNRQLSLRFFFDYRKNVPKTSQGFPRTDIRSGVMVRFQLE